MYSTIKIVSHATDLIITISISNNFTKIKLSDDCFSNLLKLLYGLGLLIDQLQGYLILNSSLPATDAIFKKKSYFTFSLNCKLKCFTLTILTTVSSS